MFKLKSFTKAGLTIVLLCCILPTLTYATPTKLKYDENGRLQVVPQDKSILNQTRVYCENMIGSVWANKSEVHSSPVVVLTVFVQIGEEKK